MSERMRTPIRGFRWAVIATIAFLVAASASAAAPQITYETAATQVLLKTKLKRPSALAFHPSDGSLWILNHADNSLAVVTNPASAKRRVIRVVDTEPHFLWHPVGISFSRGGAEFATAQDASNYGGRMGPTLWPGKRAKYKKTTRLASIHLDMLHHSPNSAGIAAGADEKRREYWVFNGTEGSIDRYFFNEPHPPGDNDHGDGLTYRYAHKELARRTNVPAQMVLDRTAGHLYIADTGNGRVARFETPNSTEGGRLIDAGSSVEGPLYLLPDTAVETVVPSSAGLKAPSGLALENGQLWVGDHATGRIHVFRLDGTQVRAIDTKLGASSLTGFALRAGWIYALDAKRHRLVRLRASA